MEDRVRHLMEEMSSYEEFFKTIITRPKRYEGTRLDVALRLDSMAVTAHPEFTDALGFNFGDTIGVFVTICGRDNLYWPIAMCTVSCSGKIADWVEEHLPDSSIDLPDDVDREYINVSLEVCVGKMISIKDIDFPDHGRLFYTKEVDCLEIVDIDHPSYIDDR